MLTEIELSNKRLVRSLKRAERKHPLGHVAKVMQKHENIEASVRKVWEKHMKPAQSQSMWKRVSSFFRRKTI